MSYNDRRDKSNQETERLNRNRNIRGNEQYAYLSDVERQLMAIQEEQARNFEVNRAQYMGDMQSNDILMQSGAMAAAGVEEARRSAIMGNQPGPGTVELLGRYGYAQPRNQRFNSSIQPGRNIVVNNNTTIQNDVRVPANIGGPVMGRPIQFQQGNGANGKGGSGKGGSSDLDRFKNWMNGNLNKQAEERAKRDKEYKDRDWSLSRSTDKLFKRLGDITKMISEKFDPRKIGADWKSQLKALLFIFITGTIAKNWKKILFTVHNIEVSVQNFLKYFTGVNGKRSQFSNDIISILGGNPNNPKEGILDNIKTIFIGDGKTAGVVQLIQKYFDNKIEDRKRAIKLVEFPEIDIMTALTNPTAVLADLMQYLGDITACSILGGDLGLKRKLRNNAMKNATDSAESFAMKNYQSSDGVFRKTMKATLSNGSKVDVDQGILAHLNGGHKGATINTYDRRGNIKNSHEATYTHSTEIRRIINEGRKTGKVDKQGIGAGLVRLQKAAREFGTVTVDPDLINAAFGKDSYERKQIDKNPHFRKKRFRVVVREKTEDEIKQIDRGGGGFWMAAAREYVISEFKREGANSLSKLLGYVDENGQPTGLGSTAIKVLANIAANGFRDKDNKSIWSDIGVVNDSKAVELVGAFSTGMSSWWNEFTANKYVFDLVAEDDPRYHSENAFGDYELYELDAEGVQLLSNRLSNNKAGDGELDVANTDFLSGIGEWSVEDVKWYNSITTPEGRRNQQNAKYYAYHKSSEEKAIIQHQEEMKKLNGELDTMYQNSRPKKLIDNTINIAENALGKVTATINDFSRSSGKREVDLVRKTSNLAAMRTVTKDGDPTVRIKTAMDFFKKELGLNDEQAAGLCGVLWSESGLLPNNFNPAEKNGTAQKLGIRYLPTEYGAGIAQWSLSRKKDVLDHLRKTTGKQLDKIEDFSLEDQLEAVVWEIKGRPKTLDNLKKSKDSTEAADIVLRGFENGGKNGLASYSQIDDYAASGGYDGSMWGETNGRAVNAQKIKAVYEGKTSAEIDVMTNEDYQALRQRLLKEKTGSGSVLDGVVSGGKGIIESLFKLVTDFITGGSGEDDDKKTEKDDKGDEDDGKIPVSWNDPDDRERFRTYTGPITKEFTDYGVYVSNPIRIRPGLSNLDWRKEVFRMTGKMPGSLESSVVPESAVQTIDKYSNNSEDAVEVDVKKIEKANTESAAQTIRDTIFGSTEDAKSEEERRTETLNNISDSVSDVSKSLGQIVEVSKLNGQVNSQVLAEISSINRATNQTAATNTQMASQSNSGGKSVPSYTNSVS